MDDLLTKGWFLAVVVALAILLGALHLGVWIKRTFWPSEELQRVRRIVNGCPREDD